MISEKDRITCSARFMKYITVIAVLVAIVSICGCTTYGYKTRSGATSYPPVPFQSVEILDKAPEKPYKIIGMGSVLGGAHFLTSDTDVYRKLQKSAAALGADAVITSLTEDGFYNRGEGKAIKYQVRPTLKLCAGEAGAKAGESPVGRIRLFTTENCVGEWGP